MIKAIYLLVLTLGLTQSVANYQNTISHEENEYQNIKHKGLLSDYLKIFVDSNKYVNASAVLWDSTDYRINKGPDAWEQLFLFDGHVWGKLSPELSFKSHFRITTEYASTPVGNHDFDPNNGIAFSPQAKNKKTWDLFNARTDYTLPNLILSAGVDYLNFSPSKRNSLVWSGNTNRFRPWQDTAHALTQSAPVAFLSWKALLGNLEYSQYLGKLSQRKAQNKYFHTHRLEWVSPKFTLALSEHIIYGDLDSSQTLDREVDASKRDIQWTYIMPFVPYFFAEHYNGDLDNSAISLDASYTHKGFKPYFELLIDDLKGPTGFFDDSWWGNKFAFSVGFEYQTNYASKPAIIFEYTRIEPWVYTHSFGNGYSMTHFNKPLGSDLGPNSQEFYIEGIITPLADLKLNTWSSWVLKGYNAGSSANSIYFKKDGEGKEWIPEDQRNEYIEAGLGFEYQISNYLQLTSQLSYYFNQESIRSSSTLKLFF
ncbi:hypothetical protein OAA91_00675 [Fibrobacterales bacterium]|nr:hypothetical protein [Fibrobacterales bacterium]